MQLAQLLKRLEPDELRQLLARHGIQGASLDPSQLASTLAEPRRLSAALLEVNQFQLALLRWLAERERHEASWSDLLDELGGRVAESAVIHFCDDLRRLALADFKADRDDGWVATYSAVASSQYVTRGITLGVSLAGQSSDSLAAICRRLAVNPLPKTKLDRQRAIEALHTDHARLHVTVNALPPDARELFLWMLNRGGIADHNALALKLKDDYYAAISYVSRAFSGYGMPGTSKASPFIQLLDLALVVGVSSYGQNWAYASYFAIPVDVATAYAGTSVFDTVPLLPPPLESAEPTHPTMPDHTSLLRDLSHLRAFIALDRMEWKQDGEPYARSLQSFGKLVKAPTKDFGARLWDLARMVPVVEQIGYGEAGYQPVDMADAAPEDIIRDIVDGWLEMDRATYLGHYSVTAEPRSRVLSLLRSVPTDTWITRASFNATVAFFWPLVFPLTSGGIDGSPVADWSALYATLLGYGKDESGVEVFQVVSSAAEIVFPSDAGTDSVLPEWEETWVVQPDRTIITPPNAHPDSLLDLWGVADLIDNQGASIFRVSTESVSTALNRGTTPDELEGVFQRRSRTALPPTIERVIKDQAKRYGQIRVGTAVAYIRSDEPGMLEELSRSAKLNKLKIELLEPTVAVVKNADEATTIEALRKAGYLPVSATAARLGGGSEPTPLHAALPIPELEQTVREAVREVRLLRVAWNSNASGVVEAVVEPEACRRGRLTCYEVSMGDRYDIPLNQVIKLSLLSPREAEKYYR